MTLTARIIPVTEQTHGHGYMVFTTIPITEQADVTVNYSIVITTFVNNVIFGS